MLLRNEAGVSVRLCDGLSDAEEFSLLSLPDPADRELAALVYLPHLLHCVLATYYYSLPTMLVPAPAPTPTFISQHAYYLLLLLTTHYQPRCCSLLLLYSYTHYSSTPIFTTPTPVSLLIKGPHRGGAHRATGLRSRHPL